MDKTKQIREIIELLEKTGFAETKNMSNDEQNLSDVFGDNFGFYPFRCDVLAKVVSSALSLSYKQGQEDERKRCSKDKD